MIDDSFAAGLPRRRQAVAQARRPTRRAASSTQLGPEAEVAIVRASEGAEHPTELTRDHLRLRDQLLALEPSARPADTTRALTRAAQLLAASSHARKTVFLISLLAKTGLRADEPPWGKDGPGARRRSTCARPKLPNLAVTALRVDPDPGAGTRGVAFDAEVGNFGDAPAKVELSLAIADRVVARGRSSSARDEQQDQALPRRAAARRARDRRVGLAHRRCASRSTTAAGSARRCATRSACCSSTAIRARCATTTSCSTSRPRCAPAIARTAARSVRVDHRRGARRHRSERARQAARAGDRSRRLRRRRARERRRAARRARRGARRSGSRAGGGILVAPGDRVDPAAYDRTMLPLLPQSLRDPIDTTWGASPDERDSRALHLVKWEADHPIFAPFSKDAPELADAKFYKISLLGPTTATADRKVLARFTNGAAALVEASIGAGRTLLFTSTLDRDWNDLPIHPGFLPLVQQAVRHLARKHALGSATPITSSAARSCCPTGDLKKLEVRGPDGLGAVFEGDRIAGRSSVRFGKTDRPGVYRVDRHRSDRRDARSRRARVRRQRRSARLRSHAGAADRAARRRAPAAARRPPTTSAASSCGTRSPRSCCCCCSPRACSSSAERSATGEAIGEPAMLEAADRRRAPGAGCAA